LIYLNSCIDSCLKDVTKNSYKKWKNVHNQYIALLLSGCPCCNKKILSFVAAIIFIDIILCFEINYVLNARNALQ